MTPTDPKRTSKILLVVFATIIALSIAASFYRFFILRDYTIESQIGCDPYSEACFIYICDPSAEECTGDPVADTSYYKLLDRKARYTPLCNPNDEGCHPLNCEPNEPGCVVKLCDADLAKEENTECTDPIEYLASHPQEASVDNQSQTTSETVASPTE